MTFKRFFNYIFHLNSTTISNLLFIDFSFAFSKFFCFIISHLSSLFHLLIFHNHSLIISLICRIYFLFSFLNHSSYFSLLQLQITFARIYWVIVSGIKFTIICIFRVWIDGRWSFRFIQCIWSFVFFSHSINDEHYH